MFAVSIAIGRTVTNAIGVETGWIILLLTYWAAEIILNSEWWSARNRLMIRGIERKFSEGTMGVIPTYYQDPKYVVESIHDVSLFVFGALGLIVYILHIGNFKNTTDVVNFKELVSITSIYAVFVILLSKCLHTREKHIHEFYELAFDLNDQEIKRKDHSHPAGLEPESILKNKLEDKKKMNFRKFALIAYLAATSMIGYRIWSIGISFMVFWILSQCLVVIIFWSQYQTYQRSKDAFGFQFFLKGGVSDRAYRNFNLALVLFFIISISVPFAGAIGK